MLRLPFALRRSVPGPAAGRWAVVGGGPVRLPFRGVVTPCGSQLGLPGHDAFDTPDEKAVLPAGEATPRRPACLALPVCSRVSRATVYGSAHAAGARVGRRLGTASDGGDVRPRHEAATGRLGDLASAVIGSGCYAEEPTTFPTFLVTTTSPDGEDRPIWRGRGAMAGKRRYRLPSGP